jgi:hypothetical protein
MPETRPNSSAFNSSVRCGCWRGGGEMRVGSRLQRCVLAVLLARGGNPVSMSEMVR